MIALSFVFIFFFLFPHIRHMYGDGKKTFNRTFYGMTYVLAQVFPPAVTYFFVYFSSKVYDDAQKEYIRESIIWQNERLKLENTHMAKLFFSFK